MSDYDIGKVEKFITLQKKFQKLCMKKILWGGWGQILATSSTTNQMNQISRTNIHFIICVKTKR